MLKEENGKMARIIESIVYSDDMNEVLGVESKSIKTARIAEGVKIIRSEAFKDCSELTDVYLPSSVEKIWYQVWKNCGSLLTVHLGGDFSRLVAKWFKSLPAQTQFACEKDSKTYKLIKRSSVLRSRVKELSLITAKTEKIKQVQKAGTDGLLCSTLERFEGSFYQVAAARKSGPIVIIGFGTFCGVFKFGTDYERWLPKVPKIMEIFSDQTKSGEEVLETLKQNKISISELPGNVQPNFRLNAEGKLILFAKGRLHGFNVANLKSLEIFGIKSLEPCAFKKNQTLESVALHSGLEKIGYMAFDRCPSLKSAIIPEGIETIDWSTFSDCSSLESINLPSSVEKIGRRAFDNCPSLESISIPDTIKEIEEEAFQNTRIMRLGKTFTIKSNDYRVMNGKRLYNGSENVTFTIKDGLAFDGTEILYPAVFSETMTIPEGTLTIGKDAFAHCYKSIKTISLPKSLRSIDRHAFFYCGVEKMEYAGTAAEWNRISKASDWNEGSAKCVKCTDGDVEC